MKCYELTATPIPCVPVPLVGEEVKESRVKLSLERRWAWGEGSFNFVFISH